MQMDGAAIKVELYRELYKERTRLTDKDFDKLVKSYPDPNHALSYLRGFIGIRK